MRENEGKKKNRFEEQDVPITDYGRCSAQILLLLSENVLLQTMKAGRPPAEHQQQQPRSPKARPALEISVPGSTNILSSFCIFIIHAKLFSSYLDFCIVFIPH